MACGTQDGHITVSDIRNIRYSGVNSNVNGYCKIIYFHEHEISCFYEKLVSVSMLLVLYVIIYTNIGDSAIPQNSQS